MGTLLLGSLRDGDTAVLLPWMLVVGVAVIRFNLLADVLVRGTRPRRLDAPRMSLFGEPGGPVRRSGAGKPSPPGTAALLRRGRPHR